jgi:cytochrome d ubiquinol oxidase subunit I
MDMTALLLSRIQFASTVSFHIIFPAFTVGLAAWLTVLEGMSIATDRPVYRRLSDFWRSVFAVAFGLGVVSGIVMAFQFGTNWSEAVAAHRVRSRDRCWLRKLHGLCPRGELRRDDVRARSRAALVLPVCVPDGGDRNDTRPSGSWSTTVGCSTRSVTRPARMAPFEPTDWSSIVFSQASGCVFHTCRACGLRDLSVLHCVRRCLAHAARPVQGGGAHQRCAALGLAAVLVPVQLLFWQPVGDFIRQAADEVRRDRGTLARRAAGVRGFIAWPNEAEERND